MKSVLLAVPLAVALVCLGGPAPGIDAQPPPGEAAAPPGPAPAGTTPARLAFIDGEVSFWRPGLQDWTPATVNMPLEAADALYAGRGANVELQIGPRSFLRAGEDTSLALENLEPAFVQFKVTSGHVSLDLRALTAGHSIEVDTPNAAFLIERTGYYRVDIAEETTTFITRRGGRATLTPAGGETRGIAPSEELVVQGTEAPSVESYVAPEIDDWDRWNYDRTDRLIDAVSNRYVSPGVYGTESLDYYGNWRVVPSYGPVWVPDGVAPGCVPYSTGSWVWDPYYSWTWVDTAPWGWAPYHYGRWVYVNGFWGWAPGPLVVSPFYSPALVAFYGGGGFGVRIGFGLPAVGWVALGWGEPLIPWWGGVGFIGVPCWHGWGGPHVVNNVVINNTTIVNVKNINVYRNAGLHNAVVVVGRDRFGHGPIQQARLSGYDWHRLGPVRGELPVRPAPTSLSPATGHGLRPPAAALNRPVVATRAPHSPEAPLRAAGMKPVQSLGASEPRLVAPPRRPNPSLESPRPPFGTGGTSERARPPLPPRFEAAPHGEPPRASTGGVALPPRPQPQRLGPPQAPPRAPAQSEMPSYRPGRQLPGEPANRLSPRQPAPPMARGRAAPGPYRQGPAGPRQFAPRGSGRSGGGSQRR